MNLSSRTAATRSFRDYARSLNRSQFRRNRAWLNREANRLDRRAPVTADGWEDAPVRPTGRVYVPRCWECGVPSKALTLGTVWVREGCGDSECCPPYRDTREVCAACLP